MKFRSYVKQAFRALSEIKKGRLHFLLLSSFFIPILLILFLDFFNIEAFVSFNQKFMFDLTWKGRMFYLFFVWLFLLESMLDWDIIIEKQRMFQNRFRAFLVCVFAAVPSIYVLSVNFLGLNQLILDLGQALKIRLGFSIDEYWPLAVEYLVFVSYFIFTTWLAYGLAGLKSFSISLSLLVGIGVIYLVDTIWPYSTLKPVQLLAVPTAACATALLDLLGYNVSLSYSSLASSSAYGALPLIIVRDGEKFARAYIAWPCAGVHSLFLYTLIILLFFRKTTMQRQRKIIFFLIGAAGTYLTNVFRTASFFIISLHYGGDAGQVFHDSYGELYFITWMFLYLILIIAIQSGKINRFTQALRKRLKVLRIYGHR